MRRWLTVQFKRMWRTPAVWIFALAALAVLAGFGHFLWTGEGPAPIGLISGKGRCSDEIVSACLTGSGKGNYRRYYDEKEMRRDILRGKLDCGFVIRDDLDQVTFEELPDPAITYLHTPATKRGLVAKEKVYSAVLRAKADQILTDMADDPAVFTERDSDLAPRLLERENYYRDSDDIFRVVFDEEETGKEAIPARDTAASGRTMIALLLVMAAALSMGRERYGAVYRNLRNVLRPREKTAYLISYALAGASPVALVMIIALPVSLALGTSTVTAAVVAACLLKIILAWAAASLAAVGISALTRSETAYLYAMTILLILVWLVMMLMRLLGE